MRGGTRESDERILAWLQLADDQTPIREIARRYGVTPKNVEQTLYQVRRADREAHAQQGGPQ